MHLFRIKTCTNLVSELNGQRQRGALQMAISWYNSFDGRWVENIELEFASEEGAKLVSTSPELKYDAQTFQIYPPITSNRVRLHVKAWEDVPAIQVEWLGCDMMAGRGDLQL